MLKPEQVASLKKDMFKNNMKLKDLHIKYSVSYTHLARIARGESWPEVLPELTRPKMNQQTTSQQLVKKIIAELKKGTMKQMNIAIKYGVTESVVSRIKKKRL